MVVKAHGRRGPSPNGSPVPHGQSQAHPEVGGGVGISVGAPLRFSLDKGH